MRNLVPTGVDNVVSLGVQPSDTVDHRVLTANVAESHNVPSGARWVLFRSTGDFYAKVDATAQLPGGDSPSDISDGSASELNPSLWFVAGASTISLISDAAVDINMAFYK
jgi:hypothetical protein